MLEIFGHLDLEGDAATPSGFKRQKRSKCNGLSSEYSNLILREDLSMAEVVELANKTVVGKSYGRHFSEKPKNYGWHFLGD
jgi:hypothetical protein